MDMATPIDRLSMESTERAPNALTPVNYEELLKDMETAGQASHDPPMQPTQQPMQQPMQPVQQPVQQVQQEPQPVQFPHAAHEEGQQMHLVPPPEVHSRSRMYDPPRQPRPPQRVEPSPSTGGPSIDAMQNDFVIIAMLCIVVHSEGTQRLLHRFVPNALRDGSVTILGLVLNAVVLALGYVVAKNVTINVGR